MSVYIGPNTENEKLSTRKLGIKRKQKTIKHQTLDTSIKKWHKFSTRTTAYEKEGVQK